MTNGPSRGVARARIEVAFANVLSPVLRDAMACLTRSRDYGRSLALQSMVLVKQLGVNQDGSFAVALRL
ncbi:MAG: hypothetical protein AAFU85_10835 [Planctomycetota bacterium]